jgi:hypothetical protein
MIVQRATRGSALSRAKHLRDVVLATDVLEYRDPGEKLEGLRAAVRGLAFSESPALAAFPVHSFKGL